MNELAELVLTYGVPTLAGTAVFFGAAPKFVVHVLVLVYPSQHPRRVELLAELDEVPYRERLIWVAGQAITVLFDGIPVRLKAIRHRRSKRTANEFSGPYAVLKVKQEGSTTHHRVQLSYEDLAAMAHMLDQLEPRRAELAAKGVTWGIAPAMRQRIERHALTDSAILGGIGQVKRNDDSSSRPES